MSRIPRVARWALVAVLALVVAVPVGTFVYINVIREDTPDRLALTKDEPESTPTSVTDDSIEGTYRPTPASTVGYRVKEILFGQRAEAVGRTNEVTGALTIEGATVITVALTADMTTVTSDEDRRDRQFQGRIMETSQFPMATFKLTQPIELASAPPDGDVVSVSATGDLTLHGVTRPVTFPLQAKRSGSNVEVNGSIPVIFADYEIDDPSFGGITTEDHGELEFLMVFTK